MARAVRQYGAALKARSVKLNSSRGGSLAVSNAGLVAASFAAHLRTGAWVGRFQHVLFSVLDTSPAQDTYAAFRQELVRVA